MLQVCDKHWVNFNEILDIRYHTLFNNGRGYIRCYTVTLTNGTQYILQYGTKGFRQIKNLLKDGDE